METVEQINEDDLEKLVAETFLTKRQAELYLLQRDRTLKDSAEIMGITQGTAYEYWNKIKDKVNRAKRTSDLRIES